MCLNLQLGLRLCPTASNPLSSSIACRTTLLQSGMTVMSVVHFFSRTLVVHVFESDTVHDLLRALHEVSGLVIPAQSVNQSHH